jgi:hypothetical protein
VGADILEDSSSHPGTGPSASAAEEPIVRKNKRNRMEGDNFWIIKPLLELTEKGAAVKQAPPPIQGKQGVSSY